MNEYNLKLMFSQNPIYDNETINAGIGLTNEQIYEIFELAFKEKTEGKRTTPNNPILSYVVGQPGAGKTGLVKVIELDNPDFVCLDVDFFTSFHPKNIELLKDPNSYIKVIHPLASACCRLAIARCLDRKYSFVLETNLRNSTVVSSTMDQAKLAKFTININVITAKSQDSYVGMLFRHYSFMRNGVSARKIEDKVHDEGCFSVQNFVIQTLSSLEPIYPISSLKVFKRDLKLLGQTSFELNSFQERRGKQVNDDGLKDKFLHELLREYTGAEKSELDLQMTFINAGIASDRTVQDKENEFDKIKSKVASLAIEQVTRLTQSRSLSN